MQYAKGAMEPDQPLLTTGRYLARLAGGQQDIARAQALRGLAFGTGATDSDAFDTACRHFLIHDARSGTLVCCFRILELRNGADLGRSYAAQFYELSALSGYGGRMAELGRFCIHPAWSDPDILRVAWAVMTAHVDDRKIAMLFGCSSFAGVETDRYLDAFAVLGARYLAPERWLPGAKAPEIVRIGGRGRQKPDLRKAMQSMPSLLRSYLMMGGRVSDHAVVDRRMNTLHVFTGLEIATIPPARKRLLRALAGQI
jgi:L-ornithine Nalpha-acyltransferase